MNMLFYYQDVLELIKNEVTPLVEGTTDTQQSKHKEDKMRDFKVLFFIHQCVDANNFKKVDNCESSKKNVENVGEGVCRTDKAKVVRLKTHKFQF